VASSHLYWDPKYDYVKYAQTAYLLKRLSRFKREHESTLIDPAVIVCGDFNSDPSASSISLFYDSQEFVKNPYYGRNKNKFDQWYARVWEDFKNGE
jgi:endonuclease/exonuclease/phosphatase family metal-dependent hydrolase